MALLSHVAFLYLTNGCLCLAVYIYGVFNMESGPIFDRYRSAVGLLSNAYLANGLLLVIMIKCLGAEADDGNKHSNTSQLLHEGCYETVETNEKHQDKTSYVRIPKSESSKDINCSTKSDYKVQDCSNGSFHVQDCDCAGAGRYNSMSAILWSELITNNHVLIFVAMSINFFYGLRNVFLYVPRHLIAHLLLSKREFVLFYTYPLFLHVLQVATATVVLWVEVDRLHKILITQRRGQSLGKPVSVKLEAAQLKTLSEDGYT